MLEKSDALRWAVRKLWKDRLSSPDALRARVDRLGGLLAKHKRAIKGLGARLKRNHQMLGSLATRIKSLSSRVQSQDEGSRELAKQMMAIEQSVHAIRDRLERHHEDLARHDQDLARHDQDLARHDQNLARHDVAVKALFRSVPEPAWEQTQFFDRLFKMHGPLKSTADMLESEKLDADIFFHHREKAEVSLTVTSSWYGGDYFEFGSHDLNTFRNMLSAYDISRMTERYPDVRFYAFDIFGRMATDNPQTQREIDLLEAGSGYFAHHMSAGDVYAEHLAHIQHHGLFRDRCVLVQGYFQDTLTRELRERYQHEGRSIGFAFLDCNVEPSYKVGFEFIFDLMAPNSYIYMDEYFGSTTVILQFDQFARELAEKREIGCRFLRNAAGFGALFRLYPLTEPAQPLSLTAGASVSGARPS